jgi:hypothetical protein
MKTKAEEALCPSRNTIETKGHITSGWSGSAQIEKAEKWRDKLGMISAPFFGGGRAAQPSVIMDLMQNFHSLITVPDCG